MDTSTSTFGALGLSAALLKALEGLPYTQPTPIQEQAIPAVLFGKDVLGIAQTGSGKTASYVLPVLQRLMEERWAVQNRHVPVLVLVPTRELALQVEAVFNEFSAGLSEPVKTVAVFGGVSINPQMIGMQGVQVLIATPGQDMILVMSRSVAQGVAAGVVTCPSHGYRFDVRTGACVSHSGLPGLTPAVVIIDPEDDGAA